jgi:predicted ester cyclase
MKLQLLLKSFLKITLVLIGISSSSMVFSQNSTDLKQWTKDYVSDLNKSDWQNWMGKYGWTDDYENHKKFRAAFTDYSSQVLEVVTDGVNVMAIIKVNAKWVGNFEYSILKDESPNGKDVEWEEVWSFNVIDGKLGDKWKFLSAGQQLMRSAGVNCLPKI